MFSKSMTACEGIIIGAWFSGSESTIIARSAKSVADYDVKRYTTIFKPGLTILILTLPWLINRQTFVSVLNR